MTSAEVVVTTYNKVTAMKSVESVSRTFGDALRKARAARMLGLREFCRRGGLDPALVSRVERGLAPPPGDRVDLRRFARGLGLSVHSPEWKRLADLAALSRGEVPRDLLRNEEVAGRLPVLFRALRDVKSDRKLLDRLLRIVREA
ncbi:MAG TPA: helix-turn-helix transcriptional regulator [Planctomycetota bacterium]|nr:helix-turn-helix transcriptional regulator [Planctomycetota bacterium]